VKKGETYVDSNSNESNGDLEKVIEGINESEFDWISTASEKPNPYVGMKFSYPRHNKTKVFTIDSIVGKTAIVSDDKTNFQQEVPLRNLVNNLDNEIYLRESNDFDWVEDIGVDPLHVGNTVYLDGTSTENDSEGDWGEGEYIILRITDIDEDPRFDDDLGEVTYVTYKTNIAGEEGEGHTSLRNARHLIDTRYWRPYNEKTGLFESNEFEWMEKADNLSYKHLRGKGIEFNPPITDEEYFMRVINTLEEIGFEAKFDWDEIFEYDDEDEVYGLYLRKDNDRIIWTGYFEEDDYQTHINDYDGGYVEVLNGRSLFTDNINESNNFDWANDYISHDLPEKIHNIQGLDYGTSQTNIGNNGSRINGWNYILPLANDGVHVTFHLCCLRADSYSRDVYYARTSDIMSRI
jgi:hypothetical protein